MRQRLSATANVFGFTRTDSLGTLDPNATGQTIDQGHDGDGVANGIGYFPLANAESTGFTALRSVVDPAGTLSDS
jgi:hypothetical protein